MPHGEFMDLLGGGSKKELLTLVDNIERLCEDLLGLSEAIASKAEEM